jgi:type IV secretory pathway TrbD component
MTDPHDVHGVPASAGIPNMVIVTGLCCVVLIFVVAGLVLSNAAFGHIWPASDVVNLKLQ